MSASAPETCPNCGAAVPRGAAACPECGSCEETGWSEAAEHSSAGLPDDEFNYSEYVKQEFPEATPRPARISSFWWLIALAALAVLLIRLFR